MNRAAIALAAALMTSGAWASPYPAADAAEMTTLANYTGSPKYKRCPRSTQR
jgi:hypothetical protein